MSSLADAAVTPLARPDEVQAVEPVPRYLLSLSTAELAECLCPEFCERDHDRD